MTVRIEFKDYVRTLIRGENAANDQVEARLEANGWEGFARYQAALFFLAVERRFGRKINEADVVQFVASMRADIGPDGPKIDPNAAETLIKSIIDDSIEYDIDHAMIGTIQASTIYKVLTEANLSDHELTDIIDEAETLASRPL